jgi:hypothetical protein
VALRRDRVQAELVASSDRDAARRAELERSIRLLV